LAKSSSGGWLHHTIIVPKEIFFPSVKLTNFSFGGGGGEKNFNIFLKNKKKEKKKKKKP